MAMYGFCSKVYNNCALLGSNAASSGNLLPTFRDSLLTYLLTDWLTYLLTYLLTDWLTYLLTHSTQHSHSWEANRFSASQEIPHILWNPKVHYHIHNCQPHVPILSQFDPVHTPPHPTPWKPILILSSHLRLGLPSGIFPSGFPTKTLYTPLLSPISATCPAHLILLDFITRNSIWWAVQIIRDIWWAVQIIRDILSVPTSGFKTPWFVPKRRQEITTNRWVMTQKSAVLTLKLWRRNYYYFFLISAHRVYKMWIIQEPYKLALRNKLHFEEEKTGEFRACLKYSVPIFVEQIYKM